jgi:hypothetical protein
LAARVAAAADREFDYLRSRAVQSAKGMPAVRVASFLAALVRTSARRRGLIQLTPAGLSIADIDLLEGLFD